MASSSTSSLASLTFSHAFKCSSSPLPAFSPNGLFLACTDQHRLIIMEVHSGDMLQLYPCRDEIDSFEWSPDSQYVLTTIKSRGLVQVFSPTAVDWECKIDEGPAGVQSARWTPDATSILILANHNIRTTAWCLQEKKCTHLPPCKTKSLLQGVAFSHNGSYMAQLERSNEAKDRVSIYETKTWSKVSELSTSTTIARTFDAVSVSWSPNGAFLAVVDDSLQYKLLIYDANAAVTLSSSPSVHVSLRQTFTPPTIPYSIISSHSIPPILPLNVYSADACALGIKVTSWSPNGRFIAIGSYDDRLRVLDDLNWQPQMNEDYPSVVLREFDAAAGRFGKFAIYSEVEKDSAAGPGSNQLVSRSVYEIVSPPFSLRKPAPPPSHSKIGVNLLCWDPEGDLIASVSGGTPRVVWIHDFIKGGLVAICHHESPVKAIQWRPKPNKITNHGDDGGESNGGLGEDRSQEGQGPDGDKRMPRMLAIVTEGTRAKEACARAFIWQPEGATVIEVPTPGHGCALVESIAWSPSSDAFALIGKEGTCLVYPGC